MKWLILWLVSIVAFIAAGGVGLLTFWRAAGGISWLAIATFLLTWYWLAPTNRYWTFVKEGTAKIVVKGDAVVEMLIQWVGYTFKITKNGKQGREEDNWEVVEGEEPKHSLGGFRYYGVYPILDIFGHWFKWTHLHENGEVVEHAGEEGKGEFHDYVFLKEDLYVVAVPLGAKEEEGAEDINGVPLGVSLALPMRIVNPYIAIFRVRRWLPMISGTVRVRLRRFVADYRYKEDLLNLRAGPGIKEIQAKAGLPEKRRSEPGEDLWLRFLNELEKDFEEEGGEKVGDEFIRIYGVEINKKKAGVLKIDPGAKYRELTTLEYEAQRKKERTVIDAEAEEERIEKLFSRIAKFGDLGKLVRTLEAAEKSPLAASLTIQAIPGLPDALRGVFGRPPEAITREEFRKILGAVERLTRQMEELRKK